MRCSTRSSNPRTRLNVRPIRRFSIRSKPLQETSCRSRRFDNPNCCRLGSIHGIIGGIDMNAQNTVFVNIPHPNAIPTPETGLRQWKSAAVGFAKDLTPAMEPKIEAPTPTIEELFEKALPVHIEGSSLGTLYRSRSRVSCFQWHDFSISRSL